MEKYTVIYSEFYNFGSNRMSDVKFIRIKCDLKEIEKALNNKNIEMSQVNYIFEGHPKQEGEK